MRHDGVRKGESREEERGLRVGAGREAFLGDSRLSKCSSELNMSENKALTLGVGRWGNCVPGDPVLRKGLWKPS